ncbi:hypothetical protein DFP92_107100 [Yoonia sediminilitoris]|uniref:Transport-associated OB type 2 domain-containing protein n=1 Tax=Yoonia sediminilitoris TaxID=1286148 RepID=A0A2T6KET4_9RHOB|nr:hypothetical protein C8N45_107100 [Yoonia sediminilitoris]RCW94810.1 hypothetical protein DFP92_107100 [Yoonia sediminilitoris]
MNFFDAADLTPTSSATLTRTVAAGEQVGLRPGRLVPTATGAVVKGKLELVKNLGKYALVHLITETGIEFIVKTDKPPQTPKGGTIGFGILPELPHYFDKQSGQRI